MQIKKKELGMASFAMRTMVHFSSKKICFLSFMKELEIFFGAGSLAERSTVFCFECLLCLATAQGLLLYFCLMNVSKPPVR